MITSTCKREEGQVLLFITARNANYKERIFLIFQYVSKALTMYIVFVSAISLLETCHKEIQKCTREKRFTKLLIAIFVIRENLETIYLCTYREYQLNKLLCTHVTE
jgi:hypothetical protein